MGGDFVPEEELNLKGIQKYYNSYTLRGRFNWVVTTYGSLFGLILLYKLRKLLSSEAPATAQASAPEPATAQASAPEPATAPAATPKGATTEKTDAPKPAPGSQAAAEKSDPCYRRCREH